MPLAWRRLLHGWPGYRSRDLTRLAVLAARRGQPGAVGRPAAERLVPHYRSEMDTQGLAVAFAEDAGAGVGDPVRSVSRASD